MKESKRSILLILMCFLVYSISYIGKYSYSTNIQNVINDLKIAKSTAGYVSTCFFACYGAGQLINGLLCEKLNSRYAITCSLVISAVITFTMFFLENILAMCILWGVNGLALSVLWCHCIQLLSTIRDAKFRDRSIIVMSMTLPTGIVFAYGLNALFTFLDFWRIAYLFASACLMAIAVLFFLIVTSIQRLDENREQEIKQTQKGQGETNMFRLFGFAVIPLFLIAGAMSLIRDGSSSWMPVLLTELYAVPDFFSILFTLALPLMGVITSLISTWLIRRTKNILLSCLLAGGVATAVAGVLCIILTKGVAIVLILFMVLSLSAYTTTNTLTAVLPLYYKGKLKSGQTAGVIDAFCYVGSALSTLFLGGVVESWGWHAFTYFLLACALLTTACAILGYFLFKRREQKRNAKPDEVSEGVEEEERKEI